MHREIIADSVAGFCEHMQDWRDSIKSRLDAAWVLWRLYAAGEANDYVWK